MSENIPGIKTKIIFEGMAVLTEECRIVLRNKELEEIFGRDELESGKLCIARIAGKEECLSCESFFSSMVTGEVIFSGIREIRGTEYYIRVRKIISGYDADNLIVVRFVHACDRELVTVSIDSFMLRYFQALEYYNVLPWKLDTRLMKLFDIFGDLFVSDSDISGFDFEGWFDVIYPGDRERCFPELARFFSGSISLFNIEYRVMDGKGGWRWIRTSGTVLPLVSGEIPEILHGFNQDITDLKRYEEQGRIREQKLRDSESRLKNAMKLGRMSRWEYLFMDDKIITDRDLSELWGYSEYYDSNRPIGREQLALRLHPDDRVFVLEKFNNAVVKGEGFDMVFRILVNGKISYVHFISEVVYENGSPVKLVGVAQDFTSVKMLESSLERKYEGLKFITDRIGIGLWDFNIPEMKLYVMNNEDQFGTTMETSRAIPYRSLLKRVFPEDLDRFTLLFDSCFRGDIEVVEIDLRFRMEDEYNWYHIYSVISTRDASGRPVTVRGLYQDITEKKEIENRLYQAQKMEAIGRLAGGVAHDFNNILQVILGYGSLALMDADNESEMFDFISNIVDSGERARNLVRQLLLFARREKFKPDLVSLNDLISGLTMMLKRVIGENISLEFIPDNGLMSIYGDPGQLEQVVMNLCINARDAVNGPGSVIIKTKNVIIDQPWPCFDNIMPAGHYAMISVADNGTGIAPENIEKIFEPFFTTKEKHSGTGLGLATAYSIVKQHNGFINLHSIEGKGSNFSIYLPIYNEPATDEQEEVAEFQPRTYSGKGTILVAEDDELIRKYTNRILTDSGFNVITACDGADALELFSNNRGMIDLMIFDVVMPRMNGWDVYNRIRETRASLPAIFISGYDANLLPEDFTSDSTIRYVQKPFKYYTLITAIQDLMEKQD